MRFGTRQGERATLVEKGFGCVGNTKETHPRSCAHDTISLVVLAILAVLLFWTSPRDGSFWWSDSPRHALNGVFVSDFLAKHPFHDPVRFSTNYYLQYPALTIFLYPPLFYVLSAPFFWFFGISEGVALMPVVLLYFALAAGCYHLTKRWLPWPGALGTALVLAGIPEVALWGRQVMLEIPCFAFTIWGIWFSLRYCETGVPRLLYAAVLLLLAAVYTKLTAIFLAPLVLLAVFLWRGRICLRDRHVWISGAGFLVGSIPLAVMTLNFGQANLQSVSGIRDAIVPRWSVAGWTWYLQQLPGELGWLVLLLGIASMASTLLIPGWRLPKRDALFLCSWFASGYVFFSLIDLKEARHSILLLYPIVLAAVVFVYRVFPVPARSAAALALGGIVCGTTLWSKPVPHVRGYRDAANYVADHTPMNGVVLFSGYRDGSFVFNMRARTDRPDLSTVRADKLLLRIAVRRELGVQQMPYGAEEIGALINNIGISYVVAQKDFWTDLAVMARLEHVLQSSKFQPVARIPIGANVPTSESELVIYKNLSVLPRERVPLSVDLPAIHRAITGAPR